MYACKHLLTHHNKVATAYSTLQLLGVKDCEDTHAWPIYCVSLAWREPLIFRGSSSKRPLADRLAFHTLAHSPSPTVAVLLFPFSVFHTASRSVEAV